MPAPKIPETVRVVDADSPDGYVVINRSDLTPEHVLVGAAAAPAAPAPAGGAASAPAQPPAAAGDTGPDGRPKTDLSAAPEDLKGKTHRELALLAKGYGLPSVGLTSDALRAMIEDHRDGLRRAAALES